MRFSSQTRFNKELYEISAVLNYAIVQQLAFFAFVCITQLFLALRYSPLHGMWAQPAHLLLMIKSVHKREQRIDPCTRDTVQDNAADMMCALLCTVIHRPYPVYSKKIPMCTV